MNCGTLHILNAEGDLTITWDESDAESVARARREVQDLKAQGYQFFLVDDSPADEVSAGRGTLKARRVEAEEVIPAEQPDSEAATAEEEPRRGRGRPRGATRVIATQPLRGG